MLIDDDDDDVDDDVLDRWMGQNGLNLNAEKTQLLWLGSRHQLAKLTVSQLSLHGDNYVIFNG